MNNFCIIANADKDIDYRIANQIRDYIIEHGGKCSIVKDRFKGTKQDGYIDVEDIGEDVEALIILGGDGTLIQAACDLHERKLLLLGVNLGTLGYLTEVETQHIEGALDRLFQDKYRIEKRLMMKCKVEADTNHKGYIVLNDFVVSKSGECRLITLDIYVNGEWIDTFLADGVIVATPTGSTGYNLSAGGPVIAPEVQAMVITPICPHTLNNRSMVVSAQDEVIIEVGQSKDHMKDEAELINDGTSTRLLKTGDRVVISRASVDAGIIKLSNTGFFKRVKDKLDK
ncbi:MAG: NAD(+)/NADH kinase [Lachnospiraceae bacterium]|nr:NAD(+)/NADH kinase [Lachnospiraceae bacterium]